MPVADNIVFGCDNPQHLFSVLNRVKKSVSLTTNIITVTRAADIFFVSRSANPVLVILCFNNMQAVLDNVSRMYTAQKTPLLCITHSNDNSGLLWPEDNIVFTCPLQTALEEAWFLSFINSILMLGAGKAKMSLAEAAAQPYALPENRDMSRMVLELDQKIDVLNKIRQRIANLYSRVEEPVKTELNGIVNTIKNCINDQKLWDDFKLYFVQTNPRFLTSLTNKFPSLTEVDLKYCCYLKMNMTNDDIRALLGINIESVRTHKYRLKKKLFLSKEKSVRAFLQAVN
ncbi:hypothetical protein GCM10027043_04440 [Ferruginibacter profundus]